ncbi:HPr-rel-A system PqqD family peptide chaperone [Roseateles violae]|uniref:HPr-rel-A system PqqD family peptide chaperone n=1 Tax=Roseateles violae TaxID=3058042 RepID=A0ABT8DTL4_9BURK|nr:HPr-rel-A system PqqD family peptide chaperone [Pelomonas sp. PFR6]MDN3919516.1 HPr-rel-A system PqqD family peptide chaperone [Pelomonas sp. PFR6]
MQWQLNALAALHWRQWDADDWVVFDEGSGQTFSIDAVAAASLMALEAGGLAQPALLEQVAADLQIGDAAALDQRVEQSLRFLAELGLVEPPAS